MTSQNDNAETPPAVESEEYEGPPPATQKTWIQGTNLLIVVLAVIFLVILLYYFLR